ncbi:response regulator transcription factor [Vreelandella aquamarina]|uniref:response regulator transcription factor n=1 Tax=Vreelandella aquamarina TaxID=77097 RepID=UPI00384BCC65
MRLAIIEDNPDMLKMITSNIYNGFDSRGALIKIKSFASGADFIKIASQDTFDIVVLNWELPDRTGLEMMEWMGEYLHILPYVIFLNSNDSIANTIQALDSGADDIIHIPTRLHELAARVFSIFRRQSHKPMREVYGGKMNFGSIRLDVINELAYINGIQIALTNQEMKLLYLLLRCPNRMLSRAYLYEYVWGITDSDKTRTLDIHIHRLRKKLNLSGRHGWNLTSVYGRGYRLERTDA